MTGDCKQMLTSLLFGKDRPELKNLKLFGGDSQDLSTEDLCEEVHSAVMQVRMGLADTHRDLPEDIEAGRFNLPDLVPGS